MEQGRACRAITQRSEDQDPAAHVQLLAHERVAAQPDARLPHLDRVQVEVGLLGERDGRDRVRVLYLSLQGVRHLLEVASRLAPRAQRVGHRPREPHVALVLALERPPARSARRGAPEHRDASLEKRVSISKISMNSKHKGRQGFFLFLARCTPKWAQNV